MSPKKLSRRQALRNGFGFLVGSAIAHGSAVEPTRAQQEADTENATQNHPMFSVDGANTGYNPLGKGVKAPVSNLWTTQTGNSIRNSSPAVVDGTLFVGSDKVYAVDAETGKQQWTFEPNQPVTTSPAVVDGTVFVSSLDHTFYALDAATGEAQWTYETSNTQFTTPAVVDETVFAGGSGGKVIALDATDGTQKWETEPDNKFPTPPAVSDGRVVIGIDYYIYVLDMATGSVDWSFFTGEPVNVAPAIVNDTVYAGAESWVYALEADTGERRWAVRVSPKTSPTIADGTVYIGSTQGLEAIDASNGEVQWRFDTDGWVEAPPLVVDQMVSFRDRGGNLYAISASTGTELWSVDTGGLSASGPAVSDGRLYYTSPDGSVHALESRFDATFSYGSESVRAGSAVTFNASETTFRDGNSNSASYEWTFGDGDTTKTGQTTTYTFQEAGNYTVSLRVSTDAGIQTVTQTIPVVPSQSSTSSSGSGPSTNNEQSSTEASASDQQSNILGIAGAAVALTGAGIGAFRYLYKNRSGTDNTPKGADKSPQIDVSSTTTPSQSSNRQSEAISAYLDTAADSLDSASSHVVYDDIDAAEQELATAKEHLTRVEDTIEGTRISHPKRYKSLRSRCNSIEASIEDNQISQADELVIESLDNCESAIAEGDLDTARSQLREAEANLDQVEQTDSHNPEQHEQLSARYDDLQASIDGLKNITSYLDTAEDCLDSASSYIVYDDIGAAKQELATAKGRLTRVEDTIEETNLPSPDRYKSLQSRCDSLEASIAETPASPPLQQVTECLDTCASAIEAYDLDRARKQLHEAETHLDELEQIASQTSGRYEQLRARHDDLQTSISRLEAIVSDLDTATECLESAASHLADDELAAANNQLTTADERLTQVEATREDLDVSLPQRYEDLRARHDSLQNSCDSLESARSMFETAAECLESATAQLDQQEFEAAKKQLSTAKGRLTRAKNTLDEAGVALPNRHETLQARCESIANTIETEQRRAQAENAVTTAVDALNSGCEAYEDGNLGTAASNFDTVTEQLATVRDHSVPAESLSPDMSLDAIAAETARGQIRVEMERAEQLVADGHEALDGRNYAAAVEAYDDALSKLRTATGIASEYDLPQSWELDQRQETIASYLANAKDQRDATDEQRSETARHRLDRATRLAETAEQHLEIDDMVAAREDIQQAQDVLDDAAELVAEITGDTTDLEHRISECTERVERIAATVPDQNQMQTGPGNTSKRDLLTYLQELSVIFGESPRAEFVDEYGFYPSSAYLEVFDSWEAALDEANLAPIDERARERRVYSRVDILDAIIDLADETGGNPTPEQMNEHGAVSTATVEKRFESWATAVQLAGLDRQLTQDVVRELASGVPATTSMAENADSSNSETIGTHSDSSQTASTDEETDDSPSRADLIAALQQMDPERGYPLTTTMREDGPYNPEQYYSEFGSWDDALAAADIDKQNRLLAEIQRVADIVGHPPTTTEMNEHSVHSSGTYSSTFPSWEAALDEVELPAAVTETATGAPESRDTAQSTPEQLDEVITLASVTDNSRLDGAIVVKLTREASRTGQKKDASFQVEDFEGATAWFNVWSTHDVAVDWEVGQWYVLENARGKAWTSDGQQKRALSSTKDLDVTELGTAKPTADTVTDTTPAKTTTPAVTDNTENYTATSEEDTTAASGTQDSSETEDDASDSAADDDDDDILDEVMGEFEDF